MTRLNLGSGAQTIRGMLNLDPTLTPPWRFQDGLPSLNDNSVAGVTCAHSLMFLPETEWPALFAEVFRVLRSGGVFRVTEDNCVDPDSERYGGYVGAVTLTGPEMIVQYMRDAGFVAREVGPYESADVTLIQVSHGLPPKVTFCEGIKI